METAHKHVSPAWTNKGGLPFLYVVLTLVDMTQTAWGLSHGYTESGVGMVGLLEGGWALVVVAQIVGLLLVWLVWAACKYESWVWYTPITVRAYVVVWNTYLMVTQ